MIIIKYSVIMWDYNIFVGLCFFLCIKKSCIGEWIILIGMYYLFNCKLFLKIGLCYLNLLGNRYYIVICGMKFNLYFLLDEYEFI